MNYLAHCYLSGENEEILVGNLLEDYVKGRLDSPKFDHYPENILKGLKLHRFIDHFTDSSLELKPLKELFYKDFGKYSPPLVDIVFDHFLAKNWSLFSPIELQTFCFKTYEKLNRNLEIMPKEMQKMVQSMIEFNWLAGYGSLNTLHTVLTRFNYKSKTRYHFEDAIPIISSNYSFINTVFISFFTKLNNASFDFRK